jgi:hypothetical protein
MNGRPIQAQHAVLTGPWRRLGWLLIMIVSLTALPAASQSRQELLDQVSIMYVAYYGRPGDPVGALYWMDELAASGGRLDAIVEAFGNSPEFLERFAGLGSARLVNNIFRQLLGRDADADGLSFYVEQLDSGTMTLASIALNVVNGVQPGTTDAQVLANRLEAANFYCLEAADGEFDYGPGQIESARSILQRISDDPATLDEALRRIEDIDDSNSQIVIIGDQGDLLLPNELGDQCVGGNGQDVWVLGFYGSPLNNTDDRGYLVDNSLLLEVDASLPRDSAARLSGELPPQDWEGDEVLVYGTFGDANAGNPQPGLHTMPVISVQGVLLSRAAMRNNSWENTLPLPGDGPLSIDATETDLQPAADEPLPQPQPKRSAAGPVLAQACDRALVISGGVDPDNNRAHYGRQVSATVSRLLALGYTESQIEVFYNSGEDLDRDGVLLETRAADKESIAAHLEVLAETLPAGCTLALFVSDHGSGNNRAQGYQGARYAEAGRAAIAGELQPEQQAVLDARPAVCRPTNAFVLGDQAYAVSQVADDLPRLLRRETGEWLHLGANDNGDLILSETEAGGADFNGDGDGDDANVGLLAAQLSTRLDGVVHGLRSWDSDRNGEPDVRLRWDGLRYLAERLRDGQWQLMGLDTNGDYLVDAFDGGVDWNLDGDTDDPAGFHEGIELWAGEVLWGDELAAMLAPLAEQGVVIMAQLGGSFGGGPATAVRALVENIYGSTAEAEHHFNRPDAQTAWSAADNMAFIDALAGIDTASWNTAATAAGSADELVRGTESALPNFPLQFQTPYFDSTSLYSPGVRNGYLLQVDLPAELVGQVTAIELRIGLQNPRWAGVSVVGEPSDGSGVMAIPGGVHIGSSVPLDSGLQLQIVVAGAAVVDCIRVELIDAMGQRLGYTLALSGEVTPPETEPEPPPEPEPEPPPEPEPEPPPEPEPEPPPVTPPDPSLVLLLPTNCFTVVVGTAEGLLEWEFPWKPDAGLDPSNIQVSMLVNVPGAGPQTLIAGLAADFTVYFSLSIMQPGPYDWNILSVVDLNGGQEVDFENPGPGVISIAAGQEFNVGECTP